MIGDQKTSDSPLLYFIYLLVLKSSEYLTMVSCILVLPCVDPALGRADKSSFTQCTLLEVVTAGIDSKEDIYQNSEYPCDLEHWMSVNSSPLNTVQSITWPRRNLECPFSVEWLPMTVDRLNVTQNLLNGFLNLECFPDRMQTVNLSFNRLTGPVSLLKLPHRFKSPFICWNRFYGTIDVTALPPHISVVKVEGSDFEGKTNFSKLPHSLTNFYIGQSRLPGTLIVQPYRQFGVQKCGVKLLESQDNESIIQ